MNTQVKIHLVLTCASQINSSTLKLSERKIGGREVLTCASPINHSTLNLKRRKIRGRWVLTCASTINYSKLTGRERGVISKASATGMSPLSPQGWVHGDFVFTPLSLTLPPRHPDDLQNSSHKLSLTLPPRHPDDLQNSSHKLSLTLPPKPPDDLHNNSDKLSLIWPPEYPADLSNYLCLISVNSNSASADPGASGSPFCGHQTP